MSSKPIQVVSAAKLPTGFVQFKQTALRHRITGFQALFIGKASPKPFRQLPNNSFKPRPLRGLGFVVVCTTSLGRGRGPA